MRRVSYIHGILSAILSLFIAPATKVNTTVHGVKDIAAIQTQLPTYFTNVTLLLWRLLRKTLHSLSSDSAFYFFLSRRKRHRIRKLMQQGWPINSSVAERAGAWQRYCYFSNLLCCGARSASFYLLYRRRVGSQGDITLRTQAERCLGCLTVWRCKESKRSSEGCRRWIRWFAQRNTIIVLFLADMKEWLRKKVGKV